MVWTMPVSTGIVCFWSESTYAAQAVDFSDNALKIEQLVCRRILVASTSLHIALCRSPALYDGQRSRVTIASADGSTTAATVNIAASDWSSPHIARVLRTLCEQRLVLEGQNIAFGRLERFLHSRVAWHIETSAIARIGNSRVVIARISLAENAKVSAFVWTGTKFQHFTLLAAACGDFSVLAWPYNAGKIAYIDYQKRLLEITLVDGLPESFDEALINLKTLSQRHFNRAIHSLTTLLPAKDSSYFDGHLEKALLACPEASCSVNGHKLLGPYRIDGEVYLLALSTASNQENQLEFEISTSAGSEPIRMNLIHSGYSRDRQHRSYLYLADASASLDEARVCEIWPVAHGEAPLWMPIRSLTATQSLTEIQAALDFTGSGDDVLSRVYYPLQDAVAASQLRTVPARRLCTVDRHNLDQDKPHPVVIVASNGDDRAVERTLVSLISTMAAEEYVLWLLLSPQDDPHEAEQSLERYTRLYNCRAEIVLSSEDRPLATTLKLLLNNQAFSVVVLLPAGAIMARWDWWTRLQRDFSGSLGFLASEGVPELSAPQTKAPAYDARENLLGRFDNNVALAWRDEAIPDRLHGGLRTYCGVAASLIGTAASTSNIGVSEALRLIEDCASRERPDVIRLDRALLRADRYKFGVSAMEQPAIK